MKTKLTKDELIHFINHIKSKTYVGMDKHLCDHLIWIVEEYCKEEQNMRFAERVNTLKDAEELIRINKLGKETNLEIIVLWDEEE